MSPRWKVDVLGGDGKRIASAAGSEAKARELFDKLEPTAKSTPILCRRAADGRSWEDVQWKPWRRI